MNLDWIVHTNDPDAPPVSRRTKVLLDKAFYQFFRKDKLPIVRVLDHAQPQKRRKRSGRSAPPPEPVPVMEKTLWKQALSETVNLLTPEDPSSGLSVSLFDRSILFYRDPDGRARIARDGLVPDSVANITRASTEKLNTTLSQLLAKQLDAHGVANRIVLLKTDLYTEQLLPLVLYDRAEERFALLFEPRRHRRGRPVHAVAIVPWRAWNGVRHVVTTAVRPATSSYRLFDVVVDLLADAVASKGRFARYPEPPPHHEGDGMDLIAWEKRLSQHYGLIPSSGTIDFLVYGKNIFPHAMAVMADAENHIDIRTYIFDTDDFAVSFARFLKAMSDNVQVRVLQDPLGSRLAAMKKMPEMPIDHESPYDIHQYLKRDSQVRSRLRPNPWLTSDHSKMWIVDNRIAFLGGINIGGQYRLHWHDLMMRIEGPIVDHIAHEFRKAWNYAGPWGDLGLLFGSAYLKNRNQHLDGVPMRLVWTKPGSSMILRTQRDAIRRSRRYIYVATPYLASDQIVHELIKARLRGVDVRVILPVKVDHFIMNANNRVMANWLHQHGVRVFLYPGMSHVKAAVFDGWACLGSANLDRLSLRFNEELNVGTSHPRTVQRLIQVLFEPDFHASEEMREPFDVSLMDHLSWIIAEYL